MAVLTFADGILLSPSHRQKNKDPNKRTHTSNIGSMWHGRFEVPTGGLPASSHKLIYNFHIHPSSALKRRSGTTDRDGNSSIWSNLQPSCISKGTVFQMQFFIQIYFSWLCRKCKSKAESAVKESKLSKPAGSSWKRCFNPSATSAKSLSIFGKIQSASPYRLYFLWIRI